MTFHKDADWELRKFLFELYLIYPEGKFDFYLDFINGGSILPGFYFSPKLPISPRAVKTVNQWFRRNGYFEFEYVNKSGKIDYTVKKNLKPRNF